MKKKNLAYFVCASLCFAMPPLAHSQAAAPAGEEREAGAGGGKGAKMKEAMKACRQQLKSEGKVHGKEMKQAIVDCVSKEHPDMAKMVSCRMSAKEKGLKPRSDEMKTFVKDCVHKSS